MMLLNFIPTEINVQQISAAAAILGTGSFLMTSIYQLFFSPLSKIPGPWYAAISPIFFIVISLRGNSVYYWQRLHKQYGPYMRVSPNTVMVADIDSAKKIHSPSDVFRKGSWYLNAMRFENLLTITDHQKFKLRRRAFGNAFSNSNLALLEPLVRKKIEFCFKKIGKHLDDGQIVDIKPWLYWTAADIVGELCFGKDFGMVENEAENQIIRNCIKFVLVAGVQAQIPYFKYTSWLLSLIPTSAIQGFSKAEDKLSGYGAEALTDLRHEIQNCKNGNPRPSLFSDLLDDVDNPNAKYRLDMTELRNESTLFIIAGTDTTALVGLYLAWVLFRNADIRQKLIAELKGVGWTQGDGDDGITDEKLNGLPYLRALIQEILRLYAPAQIGLPRVVPDNGRPLGPYFLPAGTECLTQAYTLHRDPAVFEDPLVVKPERWLNPTREMETAMMAFGGTSRVCPGQHLATMELRLGAAMMLKYWSNAELADSCTDESMELVERFLITSKGQKLELQKKKSS
ncbi:hypothetical protein TWF506_011095 [Arthrobotrys conoides]|uniref:Cytochrome P450 n=1 Tax=Arthrobotrys conoides TaxID=74498 RepID=A0AAN8N9Y9_9PEZI